MNANIEHVNVTVKDPKSTAAMLCDLFDWRIRWEGPGMQTGYTVHVGSGDSYLALFSYGEGQCPNADSYRQTGGLNHIGVLVDDLDAIRAKVLSSGYKITQEADYEPGRRLYFREENGIEIEVVSYS